MRSRQPSTNPLDVVRFVLVRGDEDAVIVATIETKVLKPAPTLLLAVVDRALEQHVQTHLQLVAVAMGAGDLLFRYLRAKLLGYVVESRPAATSNCAIEGAASEPLIVHQIQAAEHEQTRLGESRPW